MFGKSRGMDNDEDMHHHAKMAHIQNLRKKLHALVADGQDHASGMHQDEGLGEPVKHPADLAMSDHHGMDEGMEESPEEEAGESPAEEAAEGEPGEGDELSEMRKAYFKPKMPARRPGTAMMIALTAKPSMGMKKPMKGKM